MDEKEAPNNPGRRLAIGAAGGLAVGAVAGLAGGAAAALAAQPPAPTLINGVRRFDGKVVLITGATSGIGRAAANAFAREGAKVAFCGRREALGAEVEREIKAAGGEARYIKADVRNEREVEHFVAETIRDYGGLHIALNNAGVSFSAPMHESTIEDWDNLQATNVRGVFLAMRYEIAHMLEAGGGQIMVTSSANAVAARPDLGAYNASKRAIAGLVQTAALEYADRGIRVNAICPGVTDTEMVRRQAGMMDAPDVVWRTGLNAWAASNIHGLKRAAIPDEIAAAILNIASPEMTYMTGSLVFVDGGMTAAL